MDAGVTFYRKDAAEAYGLTKLPSTYQEISVYSRDMNKKIKSAGRSAMLNSAYYAFQGSITEQTVCNFIEAALSNGGGIKLENGKFIINTPQNKKALETLKGLIASKISSTKNYELGKDEYLRAFFQQGSAFAVRGWASDISFHSSSLSLLKGKVGVYEVPALVKGKSYPVAGGLHVAVAAKSASAQNAFKLADFIVSKDAQKKMALNGGITPARKDLYSDPEIISMRPEYAALPAVFLKAALRPVDSRYPKASEIMQKYISAALYGAYSPAEALDKCQAEIDGI
ncbi:MAG: putative ABC transporter-binding protein precursor [Candidatus Aerophobetes bacterium ADurb.Bin490]|nr:MAG: putative ABC transporter-binding protein precursor [Candidatus Aerophobetes bacterium ADurb.Bin490]